MSYKWSQSLKINQVNDLSASPLLTALDCKTGGKGWHMSQGYFIKCRRYFFTVLYSLWLRSPQQCVLSSGCVNSARRITARPPDHWDCSQHPADSQQLISTFLPCSWSAQASHSSQVSSRVSSVSSSWQHQSPWQSLHTIKTTLSRMEPLHFTEGRF